MSRVVVTAQMVEEAAPKGYLDVPAGAIITPLAKDVAADLGCTVRFSSAHPTQQRGSEPVSLKPSGETESELSQKVRAIVTSLLAQEGTSLITPVPSTPPVRHATQADAEMTDFPYPGPPPQMRVQTGDVITGENGSPMAAGYMTLTEGSFPWTFSYDEIQIVLEGELHIGTEDGTRIARPGEIIYIPKGSQITFSTPMWTKFVYVTFPAEWESGL